MKTRVKLAVVGGNRGGSFHGALEMLQQDVELTCICDRSEDKINQWKATFPGIQGYTSFDNLLENGNFDALLIATPIKFHAPQAIAALRAGKHVLSEVFAMETIEEGWELIEAVETSGKIYMMAENYCYMRENLMILHMVESGLFGEITYAEGSYVHDCRYLRLNAEGNLTWRGEMMQQFRGNSYPTHSLGPVAKWLGVNQRDRLTKTTTFISKQASINHYIAGKFGNDHFALKEGFWSHGDSTTTLIETQSGALIVLRFDGDSARPHNANGYSLQGTKASYLSGRHDLEEPLLWVEGKSKSNEYGQATDWDPLSKFRGEYEHPKWAQFLQQAEKAGHGGGDFFVIKDFIDSINNNSSPFIDVYDAVTWSSIVPLSAESVRRGGVPIDIPNFKRK